MCADFRKYLYVCVVDWAEMHTISYIQNTLGVLVANNRSIIMQFAAKITICCCHGVFTLWLPWVQVLVVTLLFPGAF